MNKKSKSKLTGFCIGDLSASEYLGVNVRTITIWRYHNIIPYKKVGGKIYFNCMELDKLIGKTKNSENEN